MATVALGAQAADAVVRGVVLRDSTRVPIAGVEIALDGVAIIRSGADGRFVFARVPSGRYALRARSPGLQPVDDSVAVSTADTVERTLRMVRAPTELPSVDVKAEGGPRSIALAEFEQRREKGIGKFITPADFKGRNNATLVDVLRSKVGGLIVERIENGTTPVASRRAAQSSFTPSGGGTKDNRCYMQVFVDGMKVWYPSTTQPAPPPDMGDFPVADIAGVEIYRSAAETPLQFGGPTAGCGTIVIWRRQ